MIASVAMLEQCEAEAWTRFYEAVPPGAAARAGTGILSRDGVRALAASHVDVLAYNRVLGLGRGGEITNEILDLVIDFYREAGTPRFMVQLPPNESETASARCLDFSSACADSLALQSGEDSGHPLAFFSMSRARNAT